MLPTSVPRPLIGGILPALAVACVSSGPAPTPTRDQPRGGASATRATARAPELLGVPGPSAVAQTSSKVPLPSPSASAVSEPAPGPDCSTQLLQLGISFRKTKLPGAVTPVTLLGPIGGIQYDPRELRGDCELLLTLHRLAPVLRKLGITRVRHWGGFKNKRTPSGALSLHARGLAIDIYEVIGAHGAARVKHDFVRGKSCDPTPDAVLNQLACAARNLKGIEEVMTPDRDEAHHNHLHVGVRVP